MIRKLILSIGIFCLSILAFDAVSKTVESGNQAYEEGRFDQASEIYQTLVDSGYQSAVLYFNLGNAYYKLEKIPEAILYYEKARKLEPQDKEIAYNLSLANLQTVDKIEEADDLFLNQWWENLTNARPTDGWAWLSILFLYVGLLLLIIYLFFRIVIVKKIAFYTGLCVIVLAVFTSIMAFSQNHRLNSSAEGIVFTANVTVRSAPQEDGKELFVIHEGTKVVLLQDREDWIEITLANGNSGWVRSSDIEMI